VVDEVDRAQSRLRQTAKGVTIIVRGSTLQLALTHAGEAFAQLCMDAHAVICCRVTPAQKADVSAALRVCARGLCCMRDACTFAHAPMFRARGALRAACVRAQLVKMVRSHDCMTLAIGDGGNGAPARVASPAHRALR
jgi:magnesium-transporting ATPase (P-type)